MFRTFGGPYGSSRRIVITTIAGNILHVAVLAGGDEVSGFGGIPLIRGVGSNSLSAALLVIGRQPEFGEGAFYVEVREGWILFGVQDGSAGAGGLVNKRKIGQGRVGNVMAAGAEKFALVIPAVLSRMRAMIGVEGIGHRTAAHVGIRTDKILPRRILRILGTEGFEVAKKCGSSD